MTLATAAPSRRTSGDPIADERQPGTPGDFTAQALVDPARRRLAEATDGAVDDDRTPDVAALTRACAIVLAPGGHP